MIRLIAIFFLLLLASGCSDNNDGAADVTEAHPDDFIFTHPQEARRDVDSCRACHGNNFEGIGDVIACTACHPFGPSVPPAPGFFTVHPPSWGANVIANHPEFPRDFNWTTCAVEACHGDKLDGGITGGPSCFVAGCHQALTTSPHPVPFALPTQHGPQAQDEQLFCFNCHGRPPATFDGGYVSDPAILGRPAGNCSLCHPAAQAHPTNWQGTNDLPNPPATRDARSAAYTSSHRGVDAPAVSAGCALCHNVSAAGAGPVPSAPSCFSAQFTNADGSATGCHPDGP